VAGGILKETGTSHWKSPNTGATNETGFAALPGGERNFMGRFDYIGNVSNYWSSTESDKDIAWNQDLTFNNSHVRKDQSPKNFGFSVRCVNDNASTVIGNGNNKTETEVKKLSDIQIEKKLEKPIPLGFVGENSDGKREGKGKQIYPDGSSYDGEWKDDKKNGKGKLVDSAGGIYEGYWKDDKINEDSTAVNDCGIPMSQILGSRIIESGIFKNGKLYNGVSTMTFPDGKKSEAIIKNGVSGKFKQVRK